MNQLNRNFWRTYGRKLLTIKREISSGGLRFEQHCKNVKLIAPFTIAENGIDFTKDYKFFQRNSAFKHEWLCNSRPVLNDKPILQIFPIENPYDFFKTEIIDNTIKPIVDLPNTSNNDSIQAARLIVIRRRKMKKHKLKKLRKKMKFEWAKVRQRREMRKEKAFQAKLISQIKEAEAFSAENYVNEKLKQANEIPLPRSWKGKRLPSFLIKELIAKDKLRKETLKKYKEMK